MFIPIFIAILMGLISPASHSLNCQNGGTVQVSNSGPEDPGNEPGTPTTPGGDTGGENGELPPPRPKP